MIAFITSRYLHCNKSNSFQRDSYNGNLNQSLWIFEDFRYFKGFIFWILQSGILLSHKLHILCYSLNYKQTLRCFVIWKSKRNLLNRIEFFSWHECCCWLELSYFSPILKSWRKKITFTFLRFLDFSGLKWRKIFWCRDGCVSVFRFLLPYVCAHSQS